MGGMECRLRGFEAHEAYLWGRAFGRFRRYMGARRMERATQDLCTTSAEVLAWVRG